jgi:aromatic-L-amino-acid decarboxylase
VELTQELAGTVAADDRFEIVAPHPLNLLCLAVHCVEGDLDAANRRTDALIEAVNATGDALLNRSVLDGRVVLRFSIGAARTRRADVEGSWALISRLADDIA